MGEERETERERGRERTSGEVDQVERKVKERLLKTKRAHTE